MRECNVISHINLLSSAANTTVKLVLKKQCSLFQALVAAIIVKSVDGDENPGDRGQLDHRSKFLLWRGDMNQHALASKQACLTWADLKIWLAPLAP